MKHESWSDYFKKQLPQTIEEESKETEKESEDKDISPATPEKDDNNEPTPKQEGRWVKIKDEEQIYGDLPAPEFFASSLEAKKDEKKWEENLKKISNAIDLQTGKIKNTYELRDEAGEVIKDKKTGEVKKINDLEYILKKIKDRSEYSHTEEDEKAFVRKTIEELRVIKKIIQEADSARVGNIKIELRRKKGFEYPKGNKNEYWNKAHRDYRKTWKALADYAQTHGVWDSVERAHYIETDQKKSNLEALGDTSYALGHQAVVGVLKGGAYAFLAPWKFMEFLTKKALPYFLDDKEQARKMLEAFFGKKEEKKGDDKKKEAKVDNEKEFKVKKDVKDAEKKYLLRIKDELNNYTLEKLKNSEDFKKLSPQEQEDAIKKEGSKDYLKTLRNFRIHWIKNGLWSQEEETEFRKEVGYDKVTDWKKVIKDLLSQNEREALRSKRKARRTAENHKENPHRKSKKSEEELVEEIDDLTKDIDELEKKAQDRFIKKGEWPPYNEDKGGKKKGKKGGQPETDEDVEDEDED